MMKLQQVSTLTCLLLLCLFGFFQVLFGDSELQNILKSPKVEANMEGSPLPQKQGLKASQTIIKGSMETSSIYSQPVVFVANVVPTHLPATTPTGKVQFEVDHILVATQPLIDGRAEFTVSSLSPLHLQQHYIAAIYLGDDIYASSRDGRNLWVYPAKTTSSLIAWPNPSLLNQSVKFTVSIDVNAPATAIPKGSVELLIDGASFAMADLDASGKAFFSTTAISVGTHEIIAIYKGNENFQPSQVNLTQHVDKAHTKTQLASSVNPSVFGQIATLMAKVISSAGTPGGSVQFMINGSNYGNPLFLDSEGQAETSLKDLSSGSYNVEVYYLGDVNFNPSNIFLTQVIEQAKTETVLKTSENPSTYGTAVEATAKVTSETAQPMGWIRFNVDGKSFGNIQSLPRSGQVSIMLHQLTAGSHQIKAEYSGNQNFLPSSSSLTQQVKKAKTTGLTSSKNPSMYGIPVQITATVTAEGLQPTGLIQFKIDGNKFEEAQTLQNGEASIEIQHLKAGSHQIEADYLGNENFSPSNVTLTQQIHKADTSTTVTSSANPSILGKPVTFTAIVAAAETLTGGTIQFQIDGENLGNPLMVHDSNQAALTISKGLKRGKQQIIAIYSGDENFNSSTSSTLVQIANLAVFAPTLATGFQISNAMGTEGNWINVLKWHPPAEGQPPVAYRVYRDSELKNLVATIPANQELEFIDSVSTREPFYSYFIVSVDAAGNESEPASLRVIPKE